MNDDDKAARAAEIARDRDEHEYFEGFPGRRLGPNDDPDQRIGPGLKTDHALGMAVQIHDAIRCNRFPGFIAAGYDMPTDGIRIHVRKNYLFREYGADEIETENVAGIRKYVVRLTVEPTGGAPVEIFALEGAEL